jgi:hypothetical protein
MPGEGVLVVEAAVSASEGRGLSLWARLERATFFAGSTALNVQFSGGR